MSKTLVKYNCPYCLKKFTKPNLIIHIDNDHSDMIPENYTSTRVVFDYLNKKPSGYNGKCCICGKPSGWDENKGRYNKLCSNNNCHKIYVETFENNMKNKLGVSRISQTPEGQEKMLANRKISGNYKFQDGGIRTYCGKYELKALEFLDKVMDIKSEDILTPGPVVTYQYKGIDHFYISDIYYAPYNLIIEVKDGGDNPNNRSMPEYRAKQIAKEEFIVKNTNYNYLRLTNNDFSQLLSVFMDLKLQLVDNSKDRVVHINEAMNALVSGYIPGFKSEGSSYIVNFLQNNVFSNSLEFKIGITDSIKLDNIITRDEEGKLTNKHNDQIDALAYSVYAFNNKDNKLENTIKDNMNKFVEESFLYKLAFGHKMYSYDQILCEDSIKCENYEESLNLLSELTRNYILGNNNDISKCILKESNENYNIYYNLLNNKYIISDNKNLGLYLERSNINDLNKEFFNNLLL